MYWIWLSQLNLSVKARSAVVRCFGTAEEAFRSPAGSFRKIQGISAREAEELERRNLNGVESIQNACLKQGLKVLPITDDAYPEQLREIDCPPAVLFVRGMLPDVGLYPMIAVIGTRKASPYGIRMAQELSWQLSRGGAYVISLLNAPLDYASAGGAVNGGHPCIAVLGTAHEAFRGKIPQNTVLLSEYPPGTVGKKHFFRERNRIASGLSDGVVVIEAPEKSGTRLFVREAVEQGKDIFAVPGNADAENAAGTLALIRDGAKMTTCGEDVLEEYLLRFPALRFYAPPQIEKEESRPIQEHQNQSIHDSKPDEVPDLPPDLTEDQKKIMKVIGFDAVHIDDIAEQAGLSTARVLAQLTVLEIKGFVCRESGRRFARKK